MLCSRSSRKHHTRAADSPSDSEYVSIFVPSRKPARTRASPSPRVPIHVSPLLSRTTVWMSRLLLSKSRPLMICPSFTGRVDPFDPVSQMSPSVSSLIQNLPFAISNGVSCALPESRRRTRFCVVNQMDPPLSCRGPDKQVPGIPITVPIFSILADRIPTTSFPLLPPTRPPPPPPSA